MIKAFDSGGKDILFHAVPDVLGSCPRSLYSHLVNRQVGVLTELGDWGLCDEDFSPTVPH